MEHGVMNLAAEQLARYPLARTQDLLKALYQSILGCGHFAPDRARAQAYLLEETARMHAAPHRAMIEPIGTAYCRVHLQAALRTGVDTGALLDAFLRSAEPETPARRAAYMQAVGALETLIRTGRICPDAESAQAAQAVIGAHRAAGYPQLRHTEAFRAAYAPAYRVMRIQEAEALAHTDREEEDR